MKLQNKVTTSFNLDITNTIAALLKEIKIFDI